MRAFILPKLAGIAALTAAAAVAGSLGGCDTYDPQLRAGLWHPTHPSHANSTLMAAYPADLVRGHGTNVSDGNLAAVAIERLEANKVKKLPEAGLSDVTTKSQGASSE